MSKCQQWEEKEEKGSCLSRSKSRKMTGTGKKEHSRNRTRDGKGTTPPVAKQVQNTPSAYIHLPCECPTTQQSLQHCTHFSIEEGTEKHSPSQHVWDWFL